MTASGARLASSERARRTAATDSASARTARTGLERLRPSTEIVYSGKLAAGTSSASARPPPMKVTSAPSARSAPATASAGTTCPAVPPAAITILLGAALTAQSCRFARTGVAGPAASRALPPARGRHGAHVSRRAGSYVQQQAHARQHHQQAARAVGDEWERDARQRRDAEHGENVEKGLGDDQGGHAD